MLRQGSAKPFRRQGEGFASFGSGLGKFGRFETAFSLTGKEKRQSQTAVLASRNCLFLAFSSAGRAERLLQALPIKMPRAS